MTTAILDVETHEFDVEDIEYLRHGDKPLLARVFRRRGRGRSRRWSNATAALGA